MLAALRVDDNLLHGQIAFSWVKSLRLHEILIADDIVAKDEFTKMTLGLSKPAGVKLKIASLKDSISSIKNDDDANWNMMVIVNSLKNAKAISDEISDLKSINIGLLRSYENPVIRYESMSISREDIALCSKMMAKNIELEYRLRYEDKPVLLESLIKGKQ